MSIGKAAWGCYYLFVNNHKLRVLIMLFNLCHQVPYATLGELELVMCFLAPEVDKVGVETQQHVLTTPSWMSHERECVILNISTAVTRL